MNLLTNALKGAAMGIAEIIPGVSGGTIAFISGIYERLLLSIKAFNPSLIGIYKKGGLAAIWKAIDGRFLFSLLGGMVVGLLFGLVVITHLMESHPEPLWGFFFGLIIASVFLIVKEIPKWNLSLFIALIIGAAVAYTITVVSPAEGSTSLIYVFFSGMLAISALMLPGISGSFVLLLLGMYAYIIHTLKDFLTAPDLQKFIVIAVFATGCLVGLAGFSRILTWLFKKYQYPTLAAMVGFLLGSLNKIWPWRNITSIADKATGTITKIADPSTIAGLDKETYKIITEQNVMPAEYLMSEPKTMLTVIAMILGLSVVFIITAISNKLSKS
ncbi:MAG: DUF368 domain-containing protein [Saprospiraceae bacterium]|nr:DUF368 domain-containing protein [Saprospiraceae bacterium]